MSRSLVDSVLENNDEEENIFMFIPNLIGFARVILAILACITMQSLPILTLTFYFLSVGLDAFDGTAARWYNQATKFGAVLDQLTDRCGTMCLTFVSFIYCFGFLF